MKYKIIYADGYGEVLNANEFELCDDVKHARNGITFGSDKRLINWNNVIAIVPQGGETIGV